MNNNDRRDGRFWVGLFLGGLVGAVILFFLGTKEGKKTGKLLERKTKDVLDDLEGKLADLEDKGREIVKQGEAMKDEVLETIEDKKEKLTEDMTERLDTALTQIEELQEKSRATTATLRKRLFKNIPKRA